MREYKIVTRKTNIFRNIIFLQLLNDRRIFWRILKLNPVECIFKR